MGMVVEGRWTEQDRIIEAGAFVRPTSVYDNDLTSADIAALGSEPGRFHLIASHSCQWSHRALITRQLKGLTDAVPVHIAHGPRVQGYAANGGAGWVVPGTDRKIVHLHQIYTLGDAAYTGRSTVPILWDSATRRIASNDSAAIMRGLDAVRPDGGTADFTLLPDPLRPEIDAVNADIYEGLCNGVYRAGFAERQDAYDEAVGRVFATLDILEARLADRRYLLGSTITEADWRLFPTLVRFDAIYHVLHKCCRRRLVDYPHLWAYARDLHAWRGVALTVDFDAMRQASYTSDTSANANGIVAIAPDANWRAPHGRQALGPARVALRSGAAVEVEPTTLTAARGGLVT